MFWNKKDKLPVTQEDKEWIEDSLLTLKQIFTEADYYKNIETILPTKRFYDKDFTGSEEDAQFIFEQTKIYMDIEHDGIKLKLFSNNPMETGGDAILSMPSSTTTDDGLKSPAGIYESDGEEVIIAIEKRQLKNPQALIATIAHQLSHYILLSKGTLEEDDKYLTDLLAVAYGFGVFMDNSTRLNYTSFSSFKGNGWKMSGTDTGYLPEQVIAYAMAWLSAYRSENTEWKKFLNKSMLKYFEQSIAYIENNKEEIRFE